VTFQNGPPNDHTSYLGIHNIALVTAHYVVNGQQTGSYSETGFESPKPTWGPRR